MSAQSKGQMGLLEIIGSVYAATVILLSSDIMQTLLWLFADTTAHIVMCMIWISAVFLLVFGAGIMFKNKENPRYAWTFVVIALLLSGLAFGELYTALSA